MKEDTPRTFKVEENAMCSGPQPSWEMSIKTIRLSSELVLERVKTGHIYLERFYPNGSHWIAYKFDSFEEEVHKSMPDELRPVIYRAGKNDPIKGICDEALVVLDLQASLCNTIIDKIISLHAHKDLTGEEQDSLIQAAFGLSDDYWENITKVLKYDENVAEQRTTEYQTMLEEKRQALTSIRNEIDELKKSQCDIDKQLENKIKERWDLEHELDQWQKN